MAGPRTMRAMAFLAVQEYEVGAGSSLHMLRGYKHSTNMRYSEHLWCYHLQIFGILRARVSLRAINFHWATVKCWQRV